MIAQIMAADYPDRVQTLTSIMSTSGAEHLPQGSVTLDPEGPEATTRDEIIRQRYHMLQRIVGESGLTEEEWMTALARSHDRSHNDDGFARQLWAIIDSGDRVDQLQSITQATTCDSR